MGTVESLRVLVQVAARRSACSNRACLAGAACRVGCACRVGSSSRDSLCSTVLATPPASQLPTANSDFPELEVVAKRMKDVYGCEIYRDSGARNAKAIMTAFGRQLKAAQGDGGGGGGDADTRPVL